MTDENTIPMRRRDIVENEYAPRPRARDGHKYAEAMSDFEQVKAERDQARHELDRMTNALHASELDNSRLTARVKELEHKMELAAQRATEEIDDLKDRNSRIVTRLKAGAEQFLAALQENNERSVLPDVEMRALTAVENALPDNSVG